MPPEPLPGPRVRRAESAHALLRRLHWTVIQPLASRLNGAQRSRLVGPGVEFATVREYQPGDDVRRIDWSLTARTGAPFVRESQAEGALDVWLVVDVSGSVDWGTAECLKRYRAIELTAVSGELLGRDRNRIGLLLFDDRPVAIVPPGSGRLHLERLVSTLDLHPRSTSRQPTDLAGALHRLGLLARRRSTIIVISDFLVAEGWSLALRQLAQRHEVVAARLRDPREHSLPDIGIVTFEDPETGEQLTVDTSDRRLRERFASAAQEQTRRLDAVFSSCGVDQLPLSTDQPLLPALAGFLEARKRVRHTRGGRAAALQQRTLSASGAARPTATPAGQPSTLDRRAVEPGAPAGPRWSGRILPANVSSAAPSADDVAAPDGWRLAAEPPQGT